MVDYEYEPSAEEVLGGILTLYTENMMFQALLESAASENGATDDRYGRGHEKRQRDD